MPTPCYKKRNYFMFETITTFIFYNLLNFRIGHPKSCNQFKNLWLIVPHIKLTIVNNLIIAYKYESNKNNFFLFIYLKRRYFLEKKPICLSNTFSRKSSFIKISIHSILIGLKIIQIHLQVNRSDIFRTSFEKNGCYFCRKSEN